MDRSIGINLNKEAAAMMRYKKFPTLNHTTKVHTEYCYNDSLNCNNQKQQDKNACKSSMEFEVSINGRTYKINKQNLAAIGFGALVAVSAIRTFRSLNRV